MEDNILTSMETEIISVYKTFTHCYEESHFLVTFFATPIGGIFAGWPFCLNLGILSRKVSK